MMATARKRTFSTAPITAPTAGEPVTAAAATPGLPDVSGPGRPAFVAPSSQDAEAPKLQAVPTPRAHEAETPESPDAATSESQGATPPGPPAVKTPSRTDVSTAGRIAFTWRLTPGQADLLDTLVLDLRRQLGRGRLDRAAVLQALVELTSERLDVQTDLVKRLQDG